MEARNAWGKIVGSVCSRLWVDNLFVWLCWYLIVGWQFAYLVVFAFGCGLTICLYLVLSWQFVCVVVFVFGCIWLWDDNLFVFGCELTICLCGCVCICLWVDNLFVFDCAVVVGWLAAFAVVHRVPTVTSIHPKAHPGGGRFGRFISFRIWQMNFLMEFVLRTAFGWFICLTAAIFDMRLNGQFSDGILTQTFDLFNSFFSLFLALKLIRHFKEWFPPLALKFHSQKFGVSTIKGRAYTERCCCLVSGL